MSLTICSWNVNGLRATLRTGDLRAWLERDQPDIVGMQEVKATPGQVDPATWRELGYQEFWHAAERPGYSGALLLYKEPPDAIRAGLGIAEFDAEGRVIEADIGDLTVVTAYFPNGGKKGDRLPFKQAFYEAFLARMEDLRAAGRSVLFMGDLNVARLDVDVARPAEAIKGTGFLPQERAWLDGYAAAGYVDTFRSVYPDAVDAYTYWEPWRERRARNIGWRIDYIWVSPDLHARLERAFICSEVMGSDHCPVGVTLAASAS
ncbi:MAG: exodeoxyribonuclease III [Dehalococcoidia bacterium]